MKTTLYQRLSYRSRCRELGCKFSIYKGPVSPVQFPAGWVLKCISFSHSNLPYFKKYIIQFGSFCILFYFIFQCKTCFNSQIATYYILSWEKMHRKKSTFRNSGKKFSAHIDRCPQSRLHRRFHPRVWHTNIFASKPYSVSGTL